MDFKSYITGFVDGEGCFSVSFTKRSKLNTGIEVRPSFSVSQKKFSLDLLKKIHEYFTCGAIRYSKSDGVYKYEVRSLSDITLYIIPHFQKYPLLTAKSKDFDLFVQICQMMTANLHRNHEYLAKIIDLAYQMNCSGKRKYQRKDLLKLL